MLGLPAALGSQDKLSRPCWKGEGGLCSPGAWGHETQDWELGTRLMLDSVLVREVQAD